jgi:hypothetical protein
VSERTLKEMKLFPRNLTARAAAVVRGNPVTTRPESGVENAFPGLEFDQRNLDKVFFPGLELELHHDFGVMLRSFDPEGPAAPFFDGEAIEEGIFLAFVQGRFASRGAGVPLSDRVLRFTAPAGLESWRFVRDLEVGPVAVLLCDLATFQSIAAGALDASSVVGWFRDRSNRAISVAGLGRLVLLFGERSRYLTPSGVIDPRLVQAGDLTRSLCSPWQYDFADCGCFYWASNKPDMVSSEAQHNQVLNFQRKDRSPEADQATEADDWLLKQRGSWDGASLTMRHAEMIERSGELPFVVAGKETDRYLPGSAPRPHSLLSRAAVIDRLERLAPVEHALAVEYLYAFYSMALPPTRPTSTGPENRIWTAGQEVFQVAIDEMRHLRAVNEILIELGHPPTLARATVIGEDFDGDGKAFQRPFALVPLTLAQLDWFIDVERVSQTLTPEENTIDGMYTRILRSVQLSTEFSADEKSRIAQLIKTIIDEGIDHYGRFSRAKKALAGLAERDYLRVTDPAGPTRLPEGHVDRVLQDTLDASYMVVLRALDYAFRLGDRQRGAMIEAARRAMFNMDDAARSLASRGFGAMFDASLAPPSAVSAVRELALPTAEDRTSQARAVGSPLREAIGALRRSADPDHAALAGRLEDRLAAMTRDFEALLEQQ